MYALTYLAGAGPFLDQNVCPAKCVTWHIHTWPPCSSSLPCQNVSRTCPSNPSASHCCSCPPQPLLPMHPTCKFLQPCHPHCSTPSPPPNPTSASQLHICPPISTSKPHICLPTPHLSTASPPPQSHLFVPPPSVCCRPAFSPSRSHGLGHSLSWKGPHCHPTPASCQPALHFTACPSPTARMRAHAHRHMQQLLLLLLWHHRHMHLLQQQLLLLLRLTK